MVSGDAYSSSRTAVEILDPLLLCCIGVPPLLQTEDTH
jgi:hypothetical protein